MVAMQRRQHEEEKGKVTRVRKEKRKEIKLRKVGMWSRVRCIPQPSAVCSSIRTQIAHPIVQVCVINQALVLSLLLLFLCFSLLLLCFD
jgi:hypothetical protein